MGVIDVLNYTVTCTQCGATGSAKILDTGSGWSGSSWGSGSPIAGFKTAWVGGGKEEPKLQLATCEKCGTAASITRNYSP